MLNARLLGNGHYRGNRIMAATTGHNGMRLTKFHPNQSIGERVIAFQTFSNMAAVRHLEF